MSGISSWQQTQHQPRRLSVPRMNRESLLATSEKTCVPAKRASQSERYQYIHSSSTRHVTRVEQLENILSEKGVFGSALCTPSLAQVTLNSGAPFLPLETFDDWEYDPFRPAVADYWQATEAFAFIPSNGRWQRVTAAGHHSATNRWEVTVLDEPHAGSSYCVPRLLLYFPFEKPCIFADRIVAALDGRREAENAIRFRFVGRHIFNDGHFAPGKVLERAVRHRAGDEVYGVFRKIYEDYHIALELGKHLTNERSLAVRQPTSGHTMDRCTVRVFLSNRERVNLDALRERFRRKTLLCDRNVFQALRLVSHECEMVRKFSLLLTATDGPITLDEFEKQSEAQTSRTLKYLQKTWIERSTMHLHRTLSRLGPGNFNIDVSRWKVYTMLKLKRLVEQVQYRMQDALRDLLLDSTAAYVGFLVNGCAPVWAIAEGYSWDGNLIDSPFEPERPAVFYLTIEMGADGPYYSTDPERFPMLVQGIMDDVVEQSHYIHTIEPSLLQSLIFADDLYLSSVGLLDPVIKDRRRTLLDYYTKALLPLRSYASRYRAYGDLFFTDAKEFIEVAKAADKSSSEIKEDIALQIRMRQNLKHTVPLSIVIGPFHINVQPLREVLVRKHGELTDALLKMLTDKLRLKTADLIADYGAVTERMCRKPLSIEHIGDIRAHMEGVPETVARLEDRMRGILYEYEILDGFLHNLPDADFQQKWNALALPRAVLKQMGSVREFLEAEVEKFRKQQFADEAAFTASIEEINVTVSKFTTLYDVAKVSEMSVEVRRLWKTLQELVDRGHTMNHRQELFEMAPISLNNLLELRSNFATYRDLWTVAADYLKQEESWVGNPLASVDLEAVRRGLQQAHDGLKDLLPMFADDQPQLLAVVEHFLQVVEAFRPNLDVMELLKCPHLEAIHWSQLAKEVGVKGKLSVDVGFDVFLEHGIGAHVKTIRKIVAKAEELRIEQERRLEEEERLRQQEEEYRRGRAERRQKRTEI